MIVCILAGLQIILQIQWTQEGDSKKKSHKDESIEV